MFNEKFLKNAKNFENRNFGKFFLFSRIKYDNSVDA